MTGTSLRSGCASTKCVCRRGRKWHRAPGFLLADEAREFEELRTTSRARARTAEALDVTIHSVALTSGVVEVDDAPGGLARVQAVQAPVHLTQVDHLGDQLVQH